MTVLFVVLPLALLASAVAVAAFVWASQSGQLDDLTTPAYRALEDDDTPRTCRADIELHPRESGADSSATSRSVATDQ
jgi:cbb3-type cytochrome oxidase maturation protein